MGSNNWKLNQTKQPGAEKGRLGWEGWEVNINFYLIQIQLRSWIKEQRSSNLLKSGCHLWLWCGIWKNENKCWKITKTKKILESWYRSFLLWLKGWVTWGLFGFLFCFIWAAKPLFLNINVEFYRRRKLCRLIKHHFPGLSRSYISLRDVYWQLLII